MCESKEISLCQSPLAKKIGQYMAIWRSECVKYQLTTQIVMQKSFRCFAKVEISHGRLIVLDKVEGRLMTSPFIEQTFTVYKFNEVHSAPTLTLME